MRTVFISGATGGIGEAIAEAFLESGYFAVLQYNQNLARVKALTERFNSLNYKFKWVKVDLLNQASLDVALRTLEEEQIIVDVLVNNAGVKHDGSLETLDYAMFDKVMRVNVDGPWLLSKALLPHLKQSGTGRIINITSGVARDGRLNQTNYAASKAALENITRSLAKELGKYQITVNAVAPGLIETNMTKDVSDEVKENYVQSVPIGRLVKASDVAHACLFFASWESGSISSQILGVNGGLR